MSIRLMTAVWDTPTELDPTARLVLLSLADQANDDGWCWPSLASTGRRCGVSEDTVRRWITFLAMTGLVERHPREGRSTMYRVTPSGPATPSADATPGEAATPTPSEAATPPLAAVLPEPSRNPQEEPSDLPPPDGGGAVAVLPGMPEELGHRDAGDLVRAWIDAYTAARGVKPLPSQIKRVASSAKRLARDLDDLDSHEGGGAAWPAGMHLATLAGRDAFMDLILAVGKYHTVQPGRETAWWVQLRQDARGKGLEQ